MTQDSASFTSGMNAVDQIFTSRKSTRTKFSFVFLQPASTRVGEATRNRMVVSTPRQPVISLLNDEAARKFVSQHSLRRALDHMCRHVRNVFNLPEEPALEFDEEEQQLFFVFRAPGTPSENLKLYDSFYLDLLASEFAPAIEHVGLHYTSTKLDD